MAQNINLAEKLYYNYELYKEYSLHHRRFKHKDILPLINEVKKKGVFTVEKAGESVEGREIYLLSFGKGKSKVFLWSQMHGDEATATMVMFDIFNFLQLSDDFNSLRQQIFDNLTIYFMPMVNPDGAEIYERRNISEIDINRDFSRQQTPESVLLRQTFESLKPDFGFNLHDQSTRYSVGNSFKSAAIAFLAPSLDNEKSVDSVRDNSMKLIAELYKTLSHFIPGHIAKYKDDYEPRAFGDNFQKAGTSTILIESGLWKGDPEQQFIRKLNFIALISAFYSISTKSYRNEALKTYEQIPPNKELLFDLLLRNLKFKKDNREILIDVGINRSEINYNNGREFYYSSSVEDVGDLSVFFGFEDYNLNEYELDFGKTYIKTFTSINEIKNLNLNNLYKQGCTNVILKGPKRSPSIKNLLSKINIISKGSNAIQQKLLGSRASFIIKKNGKVHFVVINGFFISVEN